LLGRAMSRGPRGLTDIMGMKHIDTQIVGQAGRET
jgi:hypothetical protein